VTTVYTFDGAAIDDLDDLWAAIGAAVNGPGGYFGRNLDALADRLAGGFGIPEGADYVFVWRDHERSRRQLGHEATARWAALRLEQAVPEAREARAAELALAQAGQGPTLFDRLVAVFAEVAPGVLRLA
jgi:RNAse (barnase) inhibitor barstar